MEPELASLLGLFLFVADRSARFAGELMRLCGFCCSKCCLTCLSSGRKMCCCGDLGGRWGFFLNGPAVRESARGFPCLVAMLHALCCRGGQWPCRFWRLRPAIVGGLLLHCTLITSSYCSFGGKSCSSRYHHPILNWHADLQRGRHGRKRAGT